MKFNQLQGFLALCLFVTPDVSATVRYVDLSSANPTPPYTNWATAATTIQDAVDAALAGDQILVTNGVYHAGGQVVASVGATSNRLAVTKLATVRSVNGPAVTSIVGFGPNGPGAVRCVYLTNDAILAGFTLTNGATDHYEYGGGVWSESTNAIVTNCVLTGNSAYFGGGAHRGTLNNCTLSGNSANSGGGTFSATLNNCTLTGNSADSGGGAYGGTLNNCTLTGNSANSGGGTFSATLNNCTLTGNSVSLDGGGASWGTLNNCIIYYNTALLSGDNYDSATLLNHCCTTPLPPGGAGNITNEPQLASPSHLSANSPCIGRGSATYLTGGDIDGEPWANPPSIGCDEYWSGSVTGRMSVVILASYTNVAAGFGIEFQAVIGGRVSASRWEFSDGLVLSNLPYASKSWAAAGDYPVLLQAYNESYPAGVMATVTVHVAALPVHHVAINSLNPVVPYSSWATAATNIQDAVDATTLPGSLVLVNDGAYQTGGRAMYGAMTNRVVIDKAVTVRSVNGPQMTFIEGLSAAGMTNGDGAIRCVYVGTNAVLNGFTLTNGHTRTAGDYEEMCGGGAWCEVSGVVTNCTLTGNSAFEEGGAAYSGTLNNCNLSTNSADYGGGASRSVLNNCVLSGNSATVGGGGTFSTLNRCTLTGNVANIGGGTSYGTINNCIFTGNSTIGLAGRGGGASLGTLNRCSLTANSADYGGGAFESTLNNCNLSTNSADYGGGAGKSTLNHCTLSYNSADYGGGARESTLNHCTLSYNSADYGGGAFESTLNNCTLSLNSAKYYGGGAYYGTLNNCTVSGNFLGNNGLAGGGVYGADLTNCIVYFNFTALGGNYYLSSFNHCCTTPMPPGPGNTANNPAFIMLWANLRLKSNSPCINAGTNLPSIGSTDLDDRPRVIGSTVDMGAYEFQPDVNGEFIGWLQYNGLPTDGSADYADSDSDLMNNWQEWTAGTAPTNALSALRLLTPVFTPPGVLLRWSSDTNHAYSIERTTSLKPPVAFTPLRTNFPGLFPTTAWVDTTAPRQGDAFYRVRTHSTNGSAPLWLETPVFVPASVVVSWTSVTNRSYFLERANSLGAASPFSSLVSNVVGQSGTTTYTDTNAPSPGPFFYRVGVQP